MKATRTQFLALKREELKENSIIANVGNELLNQVIILNEISGVQSKLQINQKLY